MSYETFWHLNPRKLEPFRITRELEIKEKMQMLDYLAWLIGTYSVEAMGVWWGKDHRPYPQEPRGMDSNKEIPNGKGEVMSDGAKFAAFVIEHNKKIRGERR